MRETKKWRVLQMQTRRVGETKAEAEINEGAETETSHKSKERPVKSRLAPNDQEQDAHDLGRFYGIGRHNSAPGDL